MKVAFPTNDKNMDGKIEDVFEKTPGFLIVDTDVLEIEYIDNSANLADDSEAGIKSANLIAGRNIEMIAAKSFDSKIEEVFKSKNVKTFSTEKSLISEIVMDILNGC